MIHQWVETSQFLVWYYKLYTDSDLRLRTHYPLTISLPLSYKVSRSQFNALSSSCSETWYRAPKYDIMLRNMKATSVPTSHMWPNNTHFFRLYDHLRPKNVNVSNFEVTIRESESSWNECQKKCAKRPPVALINRSRLNSRKEIGGNY